ncbi:hypothetical protein ACFSO7_17150 [Bacillus sp. CGMCC 1.16607]|uniref:hypothetical protein n=1 Tax=Bacillus sp. CGMCC 1.16607 TaxID=3351842 RepID=UPI003639EA45
MSQQYDQLLIEYRKIWNNRLLLSDEKDSKTILLEAINRELNDENSHPRIRRSKFEKYYLATRRLLDSPISDESKLKLIQLHNELMER